MDEENDSRTLSFNRKRPYDIASQDNVDSASSTIPKRFKIGDVRNEQSDEGLRTLSDASDENTLDSQEDLQIRQNRRDGSKANSSDYDRTTPGIAPSINWNSGSKAMIRTSLGAGKEKPPKKSPTNHKICQMAYTKKQLGLDVETSVQPPEPISASSDVSLQEDESDGGVMIHVTDSKYESGEILEGNAKKPDLHVSSRSITPELFKATPSNQSEGHGGIVKLNDSKVIKSSQPNAVASKVEDSPQRTSKADPQSLMPRKLADLSLEELKLQLRYFHLTKKREDVDLSSPARCLVCAREGHMAGACSSLMCGVCGVLNQHFTKQCPQLQRCAKCLQRRHLESHCSSSLSREDVTCFLCQRDGHMEDDCELLWRTSGRPWVANLLSQRIRLECYECGNSGHLGNDCRTRRPRKAMGTSTWSLTHGKEVANESQRGIMIKGRAQQEKDAVHDESDDDNVSFLRPGLPQPVPKGQIRVAIQSFGGRRPRDQSISRHKHEVWEPVDQPYQSDKRQKIEPWNHDHSRMYPNFRDRPAYPSNRQADRYIPERNPRVRTELYRPMPSSAHKAWIQHRL